MDEFTIAFLGAALVGMIWQKKEKSVKGIELKGGVMNKAFKAIAAVLAGILVVATVFVADILIMIICIRSAKLIAERLNSITRITSHIYGE